MMHRSFTSFAALSATALMLFSLSQPRALAREETILSPDHRITISVSDTDGLHYQVLMDGRPVIVHSRLGLELEGGRALGPCAEIRTATRGDHDTSWVNDFGPRRVVRDCYRELKLELQERADTPARLMLIVRAYDNGVALRYEIPRQHGLERYVVTNELTEFIFPSDLTCWAGDYSDCAECQYPEKRLTGLSSDITKPQVLPLVAELPHGFASVAESDLIDWAGMFLTAATSRADGKTFPGAKVTLAPRKDGHGLVAGETRRMSPWRVVMLARNEASLLSNDLIATLATPSQVNDTTWIKPGITAWDPWWTGVNPTQPSFRGLSCRGDTLSDKNYIDFAAEMGFRYQLIDWYWYEPMNNPAADLTKPAGQIDIPGLIAYARERGVRLLLWLDSRDLARQGVEKVLAHIASWGFAGVKIDFMNSDSQETVQWYAHVLSVAARHHLLVDFHGAYKPTGLARTWPNFITQEGVLGNEYNKIRPDACTTLHTVTLPFTRGLLGPMDFTPGGFLNRSAADFQVTAPAEVVGTRARQLAETVVYFSPLLCLCDSPANYRGQPGLAFFRDLPTTWDETVVVSAKMARHLVIARRSGSRWYLGGLNGDEPTTLRIPLSFLGSGQWTMRAFADTPDSAKHPESISDTTTSVAANGTLEITLAPAGGYAAVISNK